MRLLARLNEWSVAEISEIDRALDRIKARTYGLCLACHHPIESERLNSAPEVEYCSACQDMRESVRQPGEMIGHAAMRAESRRRN
jgi:RNA polymerase-binding transcription factor DksA